MSLPGPILTFLADASRSDTLEACLRALAVAVSDTVPGVKRASVMLPTEDAASALLVVTLGREISMRGPVLPLASVPPPAVTALQTGREVIWSASSDDRTDPAYQPLVERGLLTSLSVPLVSGGTVLGVLNLACTDDRKWSQVLPAIRDLACVVSAQVNCTTAWLWCAARKRSQRSW